LESLDELLDGFWIHRALQNEGIESHVVDAASIATSWRRRRAKTGKIDGETLVRVLLAYKRGEPRVCAMVKVPTPSEEDRRHLCRERKALTAERVRHVNSIKGFLFSQGVSGYQPLRRDRRQRLDELQTATAAPSLSILKRSSTESSIGLNFFSDRSRPWRPRGTHCWLRNERPSWRRHRCYLT
jgi:transposase